ncbi:MAG: CRISPR-associated protein Csx19 [Ktedonobacteraceae bacterium]
MKRKMSDITATCQMVDMGDFAHDPTGWLAQQMSTHTLTYLLAHADDGVIWGRLDKEGLITSHDVAPEYAPPLREETLLTVRIFGPAGELLVWRDEMGAWAGRLITENASGTTPEWTRAFAEQQIMLGTKAEPRGRDFTLLSEGSQGLVHVVPLKVTEQISEQHRPLRLVVCHYVKAEEHGFMRIDASRLHSLGLQAKESNS